MPGPEIDRHSFKRYDKDNKQAGMTAPSSLGWLPTATSISANGGRLSRFVPSRNMTIVSIGYAVSAFTAGDTADPAVDVGIYSAALSKLASSGATTGKLNTTGAKTVNLSASITLAANTVYYAALSVGAIGTTTGSLAGASYGVTGAHALFGATAGLVEVDAAASVHALPSTWTLGGGSAVGWVLVLRES